jgi:hypothetical protein
MKDVHIPTQRQEDRKAGRQGDMKRHEETDRGRPAFLWDLREIKSERIKREKVCVCVRCV